MKSDPIKRIKYHTFYGKKYKFIYGSLNKNLASSDRTYLKNKYDLKISETNAITDGRVYKKKALIVSDKIEKTEGPKVLLQVLIDESLHALNETIDNDIVEQYAKDLSSLKFLPSIDTKFISLPIALKNKPLPAPPPSASSSVSSAKITA
jgi:hypothetical protein